MTHPEQRAPEYAGGNIAADQWPLISAFRERGAPSFHQLGVAGARAAYEESCARNALPSRADVQVEELWLTAEEVSGHSAVRARLYRPGNSEMPHPTALFFHGGGWVMGSLDTHDSLCRHLAAEARTAVLAVDYRLSPEHPHPAPLEDARTALAWLRENGHRHGLTRRIPLSPATARAVTSRPPSLSRTPTSLPNSCYIPSSQGRPTRRPTAG
ncbi:alpha/beta hydrolase [Streptomyces pratensis]|uniref:alpha/beta hydrolase n=1 Tax=Streptomyces pratensis TaxID=1169025 RepID=UPI003015DD7E